MEEYSKNPTQNAKLIRNICIMAHVDHGKTTLADYLISCNGRDCKGLRLMDSRDDESEKGRTMKSSCVTLSYLRDDCIHLINLVDSPGHVDFASEVSTAVRLCDGTLIVVDVVDGVCAQTKTVLKQAVFEELKPILVMNKIDKLFKKKMSPIEIYERLNIVLEQINAVMGEIHNTDVFRKSLEQSKIKVESPRKTSKIKTSIDLEDWGVGYVDDSDIYFRPEAGNVIFGSAFDGWGFKIDTFAEKFSEKLDMSPLDLQQYLWGDYYVSTKGCKRIILSGARDKKKTPLFVSLILNNLHQVYDAVVFRKDESEIMKIADSLSIKLPKYLSKISSARDTSQLFSYILDKWLPLGKTVSETIIDVLPCPKQLSMRKATKLICSDTQSFNSLPMQSQELRECFMNCAWKGENVPIIVFVSKMMGIDRRFFPYDTSIQPLTANGTSTNGVEPNSEILLGFARIFSGILSVGQKVYVLSPKHDPRQTAAMCNENGHISDEDLAKLKHVTTCQITSLYILDVQNFTPIKRAFAGMMVGIGGLENAVIKSGTLSSTAFCPAFTELTMYSKPIFRVAVEPVSVMDLRKFREGLDQLNKADKCVQIEVGKDGQYVLVTGGEIHLERCMTDLINIYARVPIKHSPPIIPFRETIVPKANNADKTKVETTVDYFQDSKVSYRIKIVAVPLPQNVTTLLDEYTRVIASMNVNKKYNGSELSDSVSRFKSLLEEAFNEAGKEWKNATDPIMSFGPNYCGPNLLFNKTSNHKYSVWDKNEATEEGINESYFDSNFITGFQMAASTGTLCREPMMGVGFFVEEWDIVGNCNDASMSGQVISIVNEACLSAFNVCDRRLMLAMYTCVIEVNQSVIGRAYGLIGKRNGRIVDGDITEGSTSWNVTCYLPIIESMKFTDELRTETSGGAFPQLVFSHWETLNDDPFWKPHTEEELEHWGEKAEHENLAHQYMNTVRKRKGLHTDEKLVVSSEKQRTRSKK